MDPVALTGTYRVTKSDDVQQNIFGWASVSIRKDGSQVIDAHDETIDIADLEQAQYEFVMDARVSGEDHHGGVDALMIESFVCMPEKLVAMGLMDAEQAAKTQQGVWVGFHLPDKAAYERARTTKSMFSIEGVAIPVEV